jgi:hypothetical protein
MPVIPLGRLFIKRPFLIVSPSYMHKYKHLDDSTDWVIPPNYDSRPEPKTVFFRIGGVGSRSDSFGFFGFSYLLHAGSTTIDSTCTYPLPTAWQSPSLGSPFLPVKLDCQSIKRIQQRRQGDSLLYPSVLDSTSKLYSQST